MHVFIVEKKGPRMSDEYSINMSPLVDQDEDRVIPPNTCSQRTLKLIYAAGIGIMRPFGIALGAMAGGWLAFSMVSKIAPLHLYVNVTTSLPGPY